MLTIGSLFSGIGGLDLGLEWAGLGPTWWQVEQDERCRQLLAQHWPNAERFDDVCAVGGSTLAPVDLICGGFPCQNNSSANSTGDRSGLAGVRSGLWREFDRIIGELQPRWVVVENVTSGAHLWFDRVTADLVGRGYETTPLSFSAADVGAPHERARVFIVARHTNPRRKPVGAKHAEVAQLSSAPGRFSGWSTRPDLRMADGFPGAMGRLGNAVVPACGEVVGYVVRELAGLTGDGC
jgi:DNA (cytosine-5)-methyltransferase 1